MRLPFGMTPRTEHYNTTRRDFTLRLSFNVDRSSFSFIFHTFLSFPPPPFSQQSSAASSSALS